MKVCVIMFYDDAIKKYGEINYEINKKYCEKYNLDIILSTEKKLNNRHSAWERLPLLLENISNYDYLIWIDADAFFYNDANNIVDIINENSNINFIFSKDIFYNHVPTGNVNTGFFIVKNSEYSINFLKRWIYDEELYKVNPYPGWWDQGVFIYMFNNNILNIQENSIQFEYGILQHFYDYDKIVNKTFVLHMAGRNNDIRYEISKKYLHDIIKQEYEKKNNEKQIYLNDLKNIIINSNGCLEGNCFYHHTTLIEYPDLYSKQLNLFWCGKEASKNICEIGFNAGHSAMLMLLGRTNKPLNFTIFDIGHHPYTKPSVEYIKKQFLHVNFEYVEGDSTIIMPQWINNHTELMYTYDLVHVDGGHDEHCISNDMKNADLLVKKGGLVIIDDTNSKLINNYVDLYICNGNYTEIHLLPTYGYQHRIIKKIK